MIRSCYRLRFHTKIRYLLMVLSLLGAAIALGAEAEKERQIGLKVMIAPGSDFDVSTEIAYKYAKYKHNYARTYDVYESVASIKVGEISAKLLESALKDRFHSLDPSGKRQDGPQATLTFRIKNPGGEIKHDYEVVRKSANTNYMSKIINHYKARFAFMLEYELQTRDGKVIFSGRTTGAAQSENKNYEHPAIYDAATMAVQQAVTAFINDLSTSKAVATFEQSEKLRIEAAIPGKLNLSVSFSDRDSVLPNKALDAGEIAQLQVRIDNEGPGSATDIGIVVQSDGDGVIISSPFSAGDLAPGAQKTVNVPIRSKLSISAEPLRLKIRVTDKKGVDSDWVDLSIPAVALNPPALGIQVGRVMEQPAVPINDGDGVLENGEAIQIEPRITNFGPGKALKVKLDLTQMSESLVVVSAHGLIDEIKNGQTRTGQFTIKIPANYSAPEFRYTVRATDIRGLTVEKSFAVPIVINKSDLSTSVRLIDGLSDNTVGRGAMATCRVTVRNTGTKAAHDVSVRLHMPANIVSYDKTIAVGRLEINQSRSRNFIINVTTHAPVGDLPVMVDIFESKNKTASHETNYRIVERPKPAVKQLRGENNIVMVVGLRRFRNKKYSGVKNASIDATNFYRFLLSDEGGAVPQGNMALLTDQAATWSNIKKTLPKMVALATTRKTISIYWATHGIIDKKGTLNLLCYDSDASNLSQTAIGEGDLIEWLGGHMKANKVVLYLDLCHLTGNDWIRDLEKRCLNEYAVNSRIGYMAGKLSREGKKSVVIYSAASAPGYSLGIGKGAGSIFTHCIIDGFKGKANIDGDHWITAQELDTYLTDRILYDTTGLQRPRSFFNTAQKMQLHKLQ